MAMFPDSGVPPSDAKNSLPDVNTQNCNELWYSTSRCQPRFDPAAANAMLAELMNVVNKGEVSYGCFSLNNIETAIRYLIQRGIPKGVTLGDGPFNYTGYLDPPLTRYNNYLTLIIVPNQNNQGMTQVNFQGLGWTWILRNDGNHLESLDLRAGKPYQISYYNGYWYMVGLCASQVPLVVKGGVDAWVRTDGNDATGDGTANTPDKAFRTIRGAWLGVGSRYAQTPLFSINIRLGIPGDYDGAEIGPFGGQVVLFGDNTQLSPNRGAYRIHNVEGYGPAQHWVGLQINGIDSFNCYGVTFCADKPLPALACRAIRIIASQCIFVSCQLEVWASNPNTHILEITAGGSYAGWEGECNVVGNGHTVGCFLQADVVAAFRGAYSNSGGPLNWRFTNLNFAQYGVITSALAVVHWGYSVIHQSNVTGNANLVRENSIVNYFGQPNLGNGINTVQSGGQMIP